MSELQLVRYTGMSYEEIRRLPREVYSVLVEVVNGDGKGPG